MNTRGLLSKKHSLLFIFYIAMHSIVMGQTFEWVAPLGGTDMDQGTDVFVDGAGYTYTTGFFQGTVDFDPGAGVVALTANGSLDIFVQKLDAFGNLVWAKSFGGASSDVGEAITVDHSGNVYITGAFSDTADFDPSIDTFHLISEGFEDIFILKINPSGNLIWVKSMGGNSFDDGLDIEVDGASNVYTTGNFRGVVDFDPNAGVFNLTPTTFWSSIFVQKLDAAGNLIWAKGMYGTGSYATTGTALTLDAQGNVYNTGYFEGTVEFDPSAATGTTATGQFDAFVQKLDAQGNFVWVKTIGGLEHERAYDIVVDAANNIYTTGYFSDTVDFDPNAGVFNLSTVASGAGHDIFVQKLDAAGNLIWAKGIGGYGNNVGNALALDGVGNLYLAGNFSSIVDFDPNNGVANLTGSYFDAFAEKLDSAGNFIWVKGIGGNNYDNAKGLAVDGLGGVYITGGFKNTVDFDPNAGVFSVLAKGNFDSYTLKLQENVNLNTIEPIVSTARIFPNPSRGNLTVVSNDLIGTSIRVLNLSGQTVYYQTNVDNEIHEFNIEGTAGIYFVEIKKKGKTEQLKFILL